MLKPELRPHHALCVRFFRGLGYSDGFCCNMTAVIAHLMTEDPLLTVTDGADMICAGCPNSISGTCTGSEKVSRYDRRVSELCGLSPGMTVRWSELYAAAYARIVQKGLLTEVCGDCSWHDICSQSAL
ncbi:MAG: DUF1284 domain-containing protein [Ruminococcus sp.]|nr:DUF1284 domain-containing protein [Ruminococcus sp.]